MHRSKLRAALIDVPAEHFEPTVSFWSGALGRPPERDDSEPDYADFGDVLPGFNLMVQRVGAPARVHFDIAADDVEAEVARLKDLGATEVGLHRTWVILQDPAGLLFCVIRLSEQDADGANTWE